MSEVLDLIFKNIDMVANHYSIPFSLYRKYKNKYYEYKSKLSQPKTTNGHYIFCPWGNPKNTHGPDTCPCTRLSFEAEDIINGLTATIGQILIIKVIHEINSHNYDVTDSISKLGL